MVLEPKISNRWWITGYLELRKRLGRFCVKLHYGIVLGKRILPSSRRNPVIANSAPWIAPLQFHTAPTQSLTEDLR